MKRAMGASLSIVVVAYDAGPALERCLSAARRDEPAAELVVVDNGPGVALDPALARALDVTVVTPPSNLGFAGGCNVGASVASGSTLVFLNPDTVVAPGAVSALVTALGDPGVGIAMARLRLYDEPELLQSAGTSVHLSGLGWSRAFGEPAASIDEVIDVPAPCGAAMALRAAFFRQLGGFRDEYFLYMEDVDLGWRARMAGRRVVLVPAADVYHEYEFERNGSKRYFMERNRLVFVGTCLAARTIVLLLPVLLATEVALSVVALRQGWLRQKVSGWAWLARNGRTLLRLRRDTQRVRRVSDRDLARGLTARVDAAMLPLPRIVGVLNAVMVAYWAVARRAL